MKTCPACLYKNQDEAEKCNSCGFVFESSAQKEQPRVSTREAADFTPRDQFAGDEGEAGALLEESESELEKSEARTEKTEQLTVALEEAEARGDWAAALQILEDLSELSQDRSGMADKRMELERLYEEQRRQDELQGAENRRQDRINGFLKDGRNRLGDRLWSEAVVAFQNVLELESGHPDASAGIRLAEEQRARLADISHEADEGERKNDLERELAALEGMIPLSPDRDKVPERRDRVRRRLEEQNLADGNKREKEARQSEIDGQLRLGRAKFKHSNWSEAIVAFEQVLDLADDDEEARLLLGRARNYQAKLDQLAEVVAQSEAKGRLENAVLALEEMLPLLPEDSPFRTRLSNLSRDLDKFRKNEQTRIEEDRGLARIRVILDHGLEKMRSRDYTGATHLFEQVVRLDENNEEARTLLEQIESNLERRHGLSRSAETAAGEGRFQEAADLLRELLDITPEPETVKARLAQVEDRLAKGEGRLATAESRIDGVAGDEAGEFEQNRRRIESVKRIEQGKKHVRARSWAKAAASFQQALELDEGNDDARVLLYKTQACRKRLAQLVQTAKTAKSSGDLEGAIKALENMKPLVGKVEIIQANIDGLTLRHEESLRQDEPQDPDQDQGQQREERIRELIKGGASLLAARQWGSAMEVLGRALRMDPDHQEANRLYDQAEANRQRFEELLSAADRTKDEGSVREAVVVREDSLPLLPETEEILVRKSRLEQEIIGSLNQEPPASSNETEAAWAGSPIESEPPQAPGDSGGPVEEEFDDTWWAGDQETEPEKSWRAEIISGRDDGPRPDRTEGDLDEPGWESDRDDPEGGLGEFIPRRRRKSWVLFALVLLVVILGLVWNIGNFEPRDPAKAVPQESPSTAAAVEQPPVTPQALTEVNLTPLFKAVAGPDAAKALALEEWGKPPSGLAPDHPVWPQYLYLLGEVYRLRGDSKQAAQTWQTLVDWAAGPAAENKNMAGGLPLAALWRLLESTGRDLAAKPGEAKALLEKAALIKAAGLDSADSQAQDLFELPQLKGAVYGYLTTLAWRSGDRDGAAAMVLEYIAAGDPEKLDPAQQEAMKSAVSDGLLTEGGLKLKQAGRLEKLHRYDRALEMLAEAGGVGTAQEKQAALLRQAVLLHKKGAAPEQVLEILDPLAKEIKDADLLQEALYYRAMQFLRKGPGQDSQRYLKELGDLVVRFPVGRFTDDALLRQGVYYLDQNQVEPALEAFKNLRDFTGPNDYEDSARYKPAMYLYTRGRPGDSDQAYQLLEDLVRARPDGPLKRTALFWLGRIAEESGRTTDAKRWFSSAIEELPFDFFANRARMHLNKGQDADGLLWPDDRTAAELRNAFDKGKVPTGITGSSPAHVRLQQALKTGLYQEAVAAEKELRIKYPVTQSRHIDLGDLEKSGLLPKIMMLSSLRQDAYLAREADPAVANRLEIVSAVGREAGDRLYANNLLLSLRESKEVQSAVQHHPDYLAVAYPGVYSEVIEKTAEKYKLEPELLYGVMRLESGFYPSALSSASALGLFQFMPGTFEALDKRWNVLADQGLKDRVDYLLNPELNIDLGGRWFAQELLPRTGNMLWALAEHNAGYGAVKRWIRQWKEQGRENDVEYMVETIGYLETKGFAREVLNGITMAKGLGLFEQSARSQAVSASSSPEGKPRVTDEQDTPTTLPPTRTPGRVAY